MAQVVGKVGVLTKDGKGNFKIKVDDKWYSTGSQEEPGITQGQTVEFDFVSNPWTKPGTTTPIYFNNITKGTLKAVTQSKTQPEPAPSQAAGKPQTKEGYWDAKEARDIAWQEYQRNVVQPTIQAQSARNAAIELVKVLASEKAIVYSEAQSKQKPKDRQAVIEAYVEEFTARFLADVSTVGGTVEEAPGDLEDATVGEQEGIE